MNKKTKKLLQDLGYPAHQGSALPEALDISKDRIKQLVNQTLDAVPQERTRHIRQKRVKVALILAALLILTTTTVLAATRIDFLKLFFTGDFSSLEQHVKEPQESVTNGKFTLTLEQSLAYESRVVLVYSIEGVTEDAKEELMSPNFNAHVSIDLPEGVRPDNMQLSEVEDLRTETKRFYSYMVEGLRNPERLSLYLSLDIMTNEDRFIEIPIDDFAEFVEVTLTTPAGSEVPVRLSSLDISIEKELAEAGESRRPLDAHFRMQDGSIVKFSELYHAPSGSSASDDPYSEGPLRYRYAAVAKEILDPSQIKGIILYGVEYDFSDPSQGREVEPKEGLRPFLQSLVYYDDYLMVPLEEAFANLSGEIAVDHEGERAVIQYRGSTYEIKAGESEYKKDGEVLEFQRKPSVVYDGVLLMERYCFKLCFELDIEFLPADPLEDSMLYIMP